MKRFPSFWAMNSSASSASKASSRLLGKGSAPCSCHRFKDVCSKFNACKFRLTDVSSHESELKS